MGRCRPSLFQGFTYGHGNLTCTARESEQTQLLHGKLARESFRLGSPRHVLCCWARPLAFETYQFLTFLSPLSLSLDWRLGRRKNGGLGAGGWNRELIREGDRGSTPDSYRTPPSRMFPQGYCWRTWALVTESLIMNEIRASPPAF